MTPLEVVGVVLLMLASIGGFYKFLDSRMKSYIEDTKSAMNEKIQLNLVKIQENKDYMDKELQELKETTDLAVEHGREIEQNYNKKFQDTNTNITRTREEMITGFGKLEGLILSITTSLKKES
jgi:S-adenosylhomocysteine hydrolase